MMATSHIHGSGARASDAEGGEVSRAFSSRLAEGAASSGNASAQRLGELVSRLHLLVSELKPSEGEMRAAIAFLTEVGHACDERRQEWVLLADVLGVSALVRDVNSLHAAGATPATLTGPFYRPDAPLLELGADICLDGRGERLDVTGRVRGTDGKPVPRAMVEVWHANGEGLYENQEPDRQPEFNLRGKFVADVAGRFHFRSVKPNGYELPQDGPVGQLLNAMGCALARPAHVAFRVSAPGFHTLTTEFFDRDDPAIGNDALFNVKPQLLAQFAPCADGRWSADFTIVLAPLKEAA
jgi:protocatechuate 3,4-dioxygenase beta subunit